MATEVAADTLGEEWRGYGLQISGGNNKLVFPMKWGVHGCVSLPPSKDIPVTERG